jgi:hypothetical protein
MTNIHSDYTVILSSMISNLPRIVRYKSETGCVVQKDELK